MYLPKTRDIFQKSLLYLSWKKHLIFQCRTSRNKRRAKTYAFNNKSTKQLLEVPDLIRKSSVIACEAHTFAENLIKPCMLDAMKILQGKSGYHKPENLPLSNNAVSRRLDYMGLYIKSELCSRLQQVNFFCLQIDESTVVVGLAVLLAFVCYFYDADIQDMFLCKTLPTSTTEEEIFEISNSFTCESKIP